MWRNSVKWRIGTVLLGFLCSWGCVGVVNGSSLETDEYAILMPDVKPTKVSNN